VRFLEAIPSLKSRTALTTVYAAGLHVSEVVLLKIADIDRLLHAHHAGSHDEEILKPDR